MRRAAPCSAVELNEMRRPNKHAAVCDSDVIVSPAFVASDIA